MYCTENLINKHVETSCHYYRNKANYKLYIQNVILKRKYTNLRNKIGKNAQNKKYVNLKKSSPQKNPVIESTFILRATPRIK